MPIGPVIIKVASNAAASPAYRPPWQPPGPNNIADLMVADCNDDCPAIVAVPDITALQCLIERIRPAHVATVYEII